MDYKGLDLSAQFTGVGDVQKVNPIKQGLEYTNTTSENMSVNVLNAWTPENPSTTMPRAISGDPAGNYRFSSRFVESGAYFRLSNIQLGYTLPSRFYEMVGKSISNCRVYIGASNVFTITKYTGFDPEDDRYPAPKVFFMGLNVRF
jgi:hypothetical protein